MKTLQNVTAAKPLDAPEDWQLEKEGPAAPLYIARPARHVHAGLAEVQAAINSVGIAKGRETSQGGSYTYRGIDDVLNTFAGPLARAKIIIVPTFHQILRGRTPTRSGEVVMVQVWASYRAISLVDGSELALGSFYGEATDSLDKATSKAMSVATRNAYLQTFTCPLGPDMDPENGVEPEGVPEKVASPQKPSKPTKPAKKQESPRAAAERSLKDGRAKILEAKLKARGKTRADLEAKMGEPVHDDNYEVALATVADL